MMCIMKSLLNDKCNKKSIFASHLKRGPRSLSYLYDDITISSLAEIADYELSLFAFSHNPYTLDERINTIDWKCWGQLSISERAHIHSSYDDNSIRNNETVIILKNIINKIKKGRKI